MAPARNRFMVSATHRSSGKSTISIGLCAALAGRGLAVQPYKKGPDYIDPMWLAAASGRPCRNLDPWLCDAEEIRASFDRHSADADVALVEGNTGLHDGLALDGADSNAALARMLDLPVVLVIDARGMTRGVAPLLLGQQAFDRGVRIAGVVLNNVNGSRHEAKLRMAIEHYTDVPVLGAVQQDGRLTIVERHLGLVPSNESGDVARLVGDIAAAVARQVDLDALLATVGQAAPLPARHGADRRAPASGDIRIGIAEDRAFGFYYADDLDALRAAGATLPRFDTLNDGDLPRVDALFIGGGFPELHARELEANAALRARIRGAIEAGMPVYAECGGLMYLARSLTHDGHRYRMVGAIPGDVVMRERPVGRGYVELEETGAFPWAMRASSGARVRGHEFHHAAIENLPPDVRFAYAVRRGHGVDGGRDGIVTRNVLASFTHLRSTRHNDWAARFVDFVRRSDYYRRRRDNIVALGVPRVREAPLV
ncbi:MAG TPA: cobyrinate a,c-diamide synthase [Casimicrobiaceae bacterium]